MTGTARENRERESAYQGMMEDRRMEAHRFRELADPVPAPAVPPRPAHLSALLELAVMFPPWRGLNGACTTVADLAHFFSRPRVWPSKFHAVSLVTRAGFERFERRGSGNRAEARKTAIQLAAESAQDAAQMRCDASPPPAGSE